MARVVAYVASSVVRIDDVAEVLLGQAIRPSFWHRVAEAKMEESQKGWRQIKAVVQVLRQTPHEKGLVAADPPEARRKVNTTLQTRGTNGDGADIPERLVIEDGCGYIAMRLDIPGPGEMFVAVEPQVIAQQHLQQVSAGLRAA